jgi:TatD DNase family protein
MKFINLHTHSFSNQSTILELVNQYPFEFNDQIPSFSIGIHPWFINQETLENELKIIEDNLQHINCLAIGECGLDKRIEVPFDLQTIVFERQLLMAEKHRKPVIIHCVAAFDELIEITKKLQITVPIIIHGFSKNSQVATQLLKQGFYISFGKYLFQMPNLATVLKQMPNDRFFLETDTATQSIEEVYQLAATCKELSINDLQKIIASNFETVFNIKITN